MSSQLLQGRTSLVVVSGPPFYYVCWTILGNMNVNHITERSQGVSQDSTKMERGKDVVKYLELLSF